MLTMGVWPPEVAKTSLWPIKLRRQFSKLKTKQVRPYAVTSSSLLLNVNRKQLAAYRLPWSSVSPNYRKGPKWPSGLGHIVSPTSVRYRWLRVDVNRSRTVSKKRVVYLKG